MVVTTSHHRTTPRPSMADRVGFEPTRLFRPTRVPVVLLKPLGHLSNKKVMGDRSWVIGFGCVPVIYNLRLITSDLSPHNGQGGIRTPDTLAGITVFETAAFDLSATCPTTEKRQLNSTKAGSLCHPERTIAPVRLRRFGLIALLLDGGLHGLHIGVIVLHGGSFGFKINRYPAHPGHAVQRFRDMTDARLAHHALDF